MKILSVVLLLILTGCTVEGTVESKGPTTTVPTLLEAEQARLLSSLPQDTPEIRYGVIVGSTGEGIPPYRVVTRSGYIVINESMSNTCKNPSYVPPEWWRQYLQIGDPISWSTKGNDLYVCPVEINNLRGLPNYVEAQ